MDTSTKEQIEKNLDAAFGAEKGVDTIGAGQVAAVDPKPDWIIYQAVTEPGLYLYKQGGEHVRLVEVSGDLKTVHAMRSTQISGAITKFSGLFYLIMPFPKLPLWEV